MTSTRSPRLSVPATTPADARHSSSVRPIATMPAWPMLSTASVLRLLTVASSYLTEAAVVARELVALVAEVLDGFVVQQRIDRMRVRFGVGRVRRAVVAQAPFGDRKREGDIDDERRQRDRGEAPVVVHDQDAADDRDFEQRRQDRVDRPVEQVGRRRHAALDVARDAAGAAIEVEAQRQRVQMLEHAQRDLARRARHHAREHDLAQFLEQRRRQPQRAVCDQQQQRHEQRLRRDVELVDELLQHHRHADVGELGDDEERKRDADAQPVAPDLRPQAAERGDEAGGSGIGVGHGSSFTWGLRRR